MSVGTRCPKQQRVFKKCFHWQTKHRSRVLRRITNGGKRVSATRGIGRGPGIQILHPSTGLDWTVFDLTHRVWSYNDSKVAKSKESPLGTYEESRRVGLARAQYDCKQPPRDRLCVRMVCDCWVVRWDQYIHCVFCYCFECCDRSTRIKGQPVVFGKTTTCKTKHNYNYITQIL